MTDPQLLAELLGALPSYTEATFTLQNGTTVKGIARDYPRPGRRWTTTDGWEWFIDADSITDAGITNVTIDGPISLAVAA